MLKKSIGLRSIYLAAPLFFSLFQNAQAEGERFKEAVASFKEGYAACTQAQQIRTKDINQAMDLFDKYLQLKDKAAQLDPSILKTTEQNISREIEFCENARQDILRTKAFPIMESALEACEESKNLLAKSNTADATSAYKRYEDLYKKATDITPSIAKVSSVSIKVGRCDNLKKKIDEAEQKLAKVESMIQSDIKQVNKAMESCNVAEKTINVKQPSAPNITKTSELLKQSENELSVVANKREASATMSSMRSYQQMTNLISSVRKCQAGVNASIVEARTSLKVAEDTRANAAKEKQEQEKQLAEKARLAKEAQEKAVREKQELELKEKAKQDEIAKMNALKQKEQEERQRAEQEKQKKEAEAAARLKEKQKNSDWSAIVDTDKDKAPAAATDSTNKDTKSGDWRDLAR